ncbi:hypothetical protein F751_1596 [Auxenochlorella protothecoides]|uniref:Uncharacterized protein n=1 Tax=Auxenochlorella protothecoides TaxID=3075 RepID=A0A087SU16_AUXPR|nr:hypothetical protein F751_1596 [Auxenochlorella protothecoides]KFM29220.1 hypothetical protein F751_1596 [Auxenochlorella protothecoides]
MTCPSPPTLDPEKLLRLELEVVSLQQTLQAALLDHQTRVATIHRLQQGLQEAEERAEVSDRRSLELAEQVLVSEERASAAARQLQATEAQLASQQESLRSGRRRVAAAEARVTEVCVQLASCQQGLREAEARATSAEARASAAEARASAAEARADAAEARAATALCAPASVAPCDAWAPCAASDRPACDPMLDPSAAQVGHLLRPESGDPGKEQRGTSTSEPLSSGTTAPDPDLKRALDPEHAAPALQSLLVQPGQPDVDPGGHCKVQWARAPIRGWPTEVVVPVGAPTGPLGESRRGPPPGSRHTGPAPKYGQDPAFREVKAAYVAALAKAQPHADRWAGRAPDRAEAMVADPKRVEPVVEGLVQLCAEAGVDLPLVRRGPCQYSLGAARLSLRLVGGQLVKRCGAGHLPLLDWVERQAVPAGRAGRVAR